MLVSIVILIILIFFNAVFAAAEIAVISVNETKLKALSEEGDKRAVRLLYLTQQPASFLATIQIAITLAGFLSSAFAADYFAEPLVNAIIGLGVTIPRQALQSAAVIIITLILSYFSLIFGELVPKRVAMKKSEELSLALASMLYFVAKLFAPIVKLLTFSTNTVLKILGINPEQEDERVTEEEIRLMLAEGNQQGTIDKTNSEMINNVFEFDDISSEQICTHRTDVVALDINDSAEEWAAIINKNRHTYYPVYEDGLDNVVGILDTRDYFRLVNKSKQEISAKAVYSPWFEIENMRANKLLQRMKAKHKYFVVLIDEYGGMSGIITLHDLAEALVGDLSEEASSDIVKLGENKWQIKGLARLDEVASALEVELPTHRFDTLNGYICDITGKIPKDRETFSFKTKADKCMLSIQVLGAENHCVTRAIVKKL